MPVKRKKLRQKKIVRSPKTLLKTMPIENTLLEHLTNLTDGLFYTSEIDAAIRAFVGDKTESLTPAEILKQTKSAADTPVAETVFTEFFSDLTEIQDWFGEEETEIAQKFTHLKEFFEQNLKDLKVFKIGKIELEIYVVGLDGENNLTGIKTKAVET